jgi:L-malate glycosyltransferase
MKIGIVCYPSIGGSGIVASELGKELSRRGHEIHFISYDIPMKLEGSTEQFHFHHVEVPIYPLFRFPPYTIALASKIYETSKANPLDILHAHYAVPHSTSAFLAKQMLCSRGEPHLKVITTLHGTDTALVGQMQSYKPVVEYSIDYSDAVTAVSEYLREQTLRDFDIHQNVHVIHNPIDTGLFTPPEKKTVNGIKRIVHISNFRPVKRIGDTIKVFDLISKCVPSELLFIGEGPERSGAEEMVQQLGLNQKVTFMGRRPDVEEILKTADLLLCTSETESFGMSIAEAMATQVPVVATRTGGIPEVVAHGETGYLAPVGDIQALGQAAVKLLSNPDLLTRFGIASLERIKRCFDLERITTKYEELYETVRKQPHSHCNNKHHLSK